MREIFDAEWKMKMVIAESAKDVLQMVGIISDRLIPGSIVAFDFETEKVKGDDDDSVNPLADSLFSVSFACDEEIVYAFRLQKDGQWLYPEMIVSEIVSLFKKLFNRGITKILHNMKFDLKLVYRITGMLPFVDDLSWDDTMIMSYLVDENRTTKLKSAAGRYLGIDANKYESMLNDAGKISKINDIDWFITAQYNCADSWMTRRLRDVLWGRLIEEGLDSLYKNLYKGLLITLMEAEIKGFRVNAEYLKEQLKKLEEGLDSKDKFMKKFGEDVFTKKILSLQDHLIRLKFEMKELAEGSPEKIGMQKSGEDLEKSLNFLVTTVKNGFNPRSTKQLKELVTLMDLARYIEKTTNKGGMSLDKEVLDEIVSKDSSGFIQTLIDFRKDEKTRGTIQGLLDRMDKDSFIHSSYLAHGTVTGRLSSRDPNLQNLPTGHLIRDAFIPRDGHDLIVADFSQIELRVAAYYANEQTMLQIFAEGGDIHSKTALECFDLNVPVEEVKKLFPDLRRKAKIINFGILYGLSDYSLGKTLECSQKDAGMYIGKYYETFPGLKTLREDTIKEVLETETVTNLFGRKRRFPGLREAYYKFGANDKEIAHQLREAFNALIQSTAVDICNLSITKIRKRFFELELLIWLLGQVHDEMVWEPEQEDTEQAVEIIEEIAPNIVEGFVAPIEIKVCRNWGEK